MMRGVIPEAVQHDVMHRRSGIVVKEIRSLK